MFEGRFGEILVIFILALVILGPEKLPKVVAEFGRWVGRARSMARQFREQLEEEVRLEEVRKAQAATPKPPVPEPASAPPAVPEPPVDVAAAMNPHTMQPTIDVTGLPPALAQAALHPEGVPAPVPETPVPVPEPPATAPAAVAVQEPAAPPAASVPVSEGSHS